MAKSANLRVFVLLLLGARLGAAYNQGTCKDDRTVIVHLFNWKWTDIAEECERFLGPKKFCGVQVSPPNEHRVITSPFRPWWERYQPISYKLDSRSGSRQEFIDMVHRCNNVGVGIYVDAVVNHMCGAGGGNQQGSGGSWFNPSALEFPGVPFGPTDFNCCNCNKCSTSTCDIQNYNDANQVRNCRLVSLLDLDLGKDYVRQKVSDYFNDLLEIGVAGFRVDACKHMWPGDIQAIYDRVNTLNTRWFPSGTRPFIFNEVIDLGGEPIKATEYTHLGRVTEFKYCNDLARAFRRQFSLKDLRTIGESWGLLPSDKALVFLDNHDNQRGHGAGGSDILTFYEPRMYKMATAFKLAHPYGFARIMSSYRWEGGRFNNDWMGPPSNGETIKDVPINSDGTCGDDWVCEHRWRQITNMALFRNVAKGEPMSNWWDNGNNQIAFSRGGKAFIAFNNEEWNDLSATLQTGLSEGTYCDIISGNLEGSSCSGTSVNVDSSGRASIFISSSSEDPIVAFHAESKVGFGGGNPPTNLPPGTTPVPPPSSGGYNDDTCAEGRSVIVHLFSWKWTDIAAECERYLGPTGFCGVQVSPPNEHRIVTSPDRPWWERYQPVSYKLDSRSGNRQEFVDMVQRCNNVGVRIYVDAVVNHMTGSDAGSGTGSGGSSHDTSSLSFPGVPFGPNDFNCCNCQKCSTPNCNIQNYGDANQVRNCRLVGLIDLDVNSDYVRQKIADYFNDLIDIGVAGFRVDACKHMWPRDLEAVYDRVNTLNPQWFPNARKPFIFNEVIDLGGEPIKATEYTHLGRVTEFKYCNDLARAFRRQFSLKNLRTIGESWGLLPSDKALVFLDNHDNQRGHGAGGSDILTFYEPKMYKMATAFKLAYPYGFTRIMSSYRWEGGRFNNDWMGPPSNGGTIKDVPINSDGTCGDDWVCEHRWHPIGNMVQFRNVAGQEPVANWWDNGNNQIAFSRGNKAFIAINNEEWDDLSANIQTGLPEGAYCDIISGCVDGEGCSGTTVNVDSSGMAFISISRSSDDPVIAIHLESQVGSNPGTSPPELSTALTPGTTASPTAPPQGYQRTVVLIQFVSQPGQDMFIRGGISHDRRSGCTSDAATSSCAISIRHNELGTTSHYDKHNAWRVSDNKLDWYGAEFGQGAYNGQQASGSPTAWTTNQQGHSGYQPVNKYGAHHWLLDVNMGCSETEDGWFELKAFMTNFSSNGGWEGDIDQAAKCSGSARGSRPYPSNNHMARCGFVNVFEFNGSGCRIDSL